MQELDKRILDINNQVKENKGEIILSFREFCFPGKVTGDFVPPMPENYTYYEAGIINGEMQKKEDYLTLRFPVLFSNEEPSYLTITQYSIPVNRKIQGFLTFLNSFNFDIEKDLAQIKDGEISFGLLDLKNNNSFFKQDSPLQKFSLLIGDKEVENFLREKEINGTEEFFDIFYHTEKIDGKISRHHFDERKRFGVELSLRANSIADNFYTVISLEEILMNTKQINKNFQDGSDCSYWDNAAEFYRYENLRKHLSKNIIELNKELEKGEKLYAGTNFPLIKGDVIGFPGAILFSEYSRWLKDEFFPKIKQTLEKIDKHLKEEENKEKNGNY